MENKKEVIVIGGGTSKELAIELAHKTIKLGLPLVVESKPIEAKPPPEPMYLEIQPIEEPPPFFDDGKDYRNDAKHKATCAKNRKKRKKRKKR